MNIIYYILLLLLYLKKVFGHGRLMDPPARNAMWRFGYSTPVNYNDNENYCGGFAVHFSQNKGKCGICGDNYADNQPRKHETGGKYGKEIIVKRYNVGQVLDVEVELTTNHRGTFQFKLCPTGKNKVATQECLDETPLFLADDLSTSLYSISNKSTKRGIFKYSLRLPPTLTCNRCVLQWTYRTGNTWGYCNNGTGMIGCGKQEHFINCADIQIFTNIQGFPPIAIESPNSIVYRNTVNGKKEELVVRHSVCIASGVFRFWPNSDRWCQENCLKYPPHCPETKCTCLTDCIAIGELKDEQGADIFCHRECLKYPFDCPSDKCKCFGSNVRTEADIQSGSTSANAPLILSNKGEDTIDDIILEY